MISLVAPFVLLLTSPLIARILGPEGRGVMAYVLTILVLLDTIALGGAVNYFLVEAKTNKEFSEKMYLIARHLKKTTLIASLLSIILATRYLSSGIGTFFFLVLLLNSFRSARSVELKKVLAVINSDWRTLNRERILIPFLRLLLTFIAYYLHIREPLIFVSLQVFAGVTVSQFCFRKYSIPRHQEIGKASRSKSSINSYFIWSIFENIGYWGVNLLIAVLIPAYEFGILAIALVAGEVVLNVEKFFVKYQTTLHIESASYDTASSHKRELFTYKLFSLFVLIYAVLVYFSIPLVFGYEYSSSVVPSVFCICASYLRLFLRLQNYTLAQQGGKHPAVIAEFSIVVSGFLFGSVLLIFPNAIAGSVIILASVLVGLIVSLVSRHKV